MSLERNVKRLHRLSEVDEIRHIVDENKSERSALVLALQQLNLGRRDDSGGVQLLTGTHGNNSRGMVLINRSRRSDGRPVADKIAETVAEMQALDVVISHRTLKLVGFGSDSIRFYFQEHRVNEE